MPITRARKVLFLSHDAGRTGAPILLLNFQRWLKSNSDIEFATVLRRTGPLASSFAALGDLVVLEGGQEAVSRRRYPVRRFREALSSTRLAALRRTGYQLLYSNTVTNGDLMERLASPSVPAITHVHELQYWIEKSGSRNWEQVRRHTTRYIAASEAVAVNLRVRHNVPAEAVDVVHESIPVDDSKFARARATADRLRASLHIDPRAFVIGGSGAETWRKGKDLFVQLAASVRRRRLSSPCHFVWVGWPGTEDERRQLSHDAELSGVTSLVHWVGEVTNPTDYFAVFDVFALMSREDPFPLVCLEAAVLERPVLCFAGAGGAPELVGDDAGYIVPYLDLEGMADKIEILAADCDLRHRMGSNAAAKVRTRYAVEATAPSLLRIIEDLLAAQGDRQ